MSFEIITSDYFDTEAKALAKDTKVSKGFDRVSEGIRKTPLQGVK